MKLLLIDNSNSLTKFTLVDENEVVGDGVAEKTADITAESLDVLTKRWEYDAVMLCSVVPEKEKIISEFFKDKPFHSLSYKSDHGVDIQLDQPEQIGADRIANAIAVKNLYKESAIVIDFGTAVTFDVIDYRGAYAGGGIAPGLALMSNYLSNHTALLPKIDLKEPDRVIGKSTETAMLSGVIYGYRGLVKEILKGIVSEMKSDSPTIIATGGYGKLISTHIDEIDSYCENITLEGLKSVAVAFFKKPV